MMFGGIILIIVIIYLMNNNNINFNSNSIGNNNSNQALDVLKKRYANGEINEEEYLRKKNILIR